MNTDTLHDLNDQDLAQLISEAQVLLKARVEKRRKDAMDQIREIAATAKIVVKFDGARKPRRGKASLRAGDRYVNPDHASQFYVVGNSKPPKWFCVLREKGRLPEPTIKPMEA